MSRESKRNRPEYRFSWQCWFSRRAKRAGPAAALATRHFISVWRVMARRRSKGGNPSILDFREFGARYPYAFLIRRNAARIRKAVRCGATEKRMSRCGLFDPLKHHQVYRSQPVLAKRKQQVRRPTRPF